MSLYSHAIRVIPSSAGKIGHIRSTASSTPVQPSWLTAILCCFAAWKTGEGYPTFVPLAPRTESMDGESIPSQH